MFSSCSLYFAVEKHSGESRCRTLSIGGVMHSVQKVHMPQNQKLASTLAGTNMDGGQWPYSEDHFQKTNQRAFHFHVSSRECSNFLAGQVRSCGVNGFCSSSSHYENPYSCGDRGSEFLHNEFDPEKLRSNASRPQMAEDLFALSTA